MTTRQLQLRAFREWNSSAATRGRYHTFEFYWCEKYARVYRLPTRIESVADLAH